MPEPTASPGNPKLYCENLRLVSVDLNPQQAFDTTAAADTGTDGIEVM